MIAQIDSDYVRMRPSRLPSRLLSYALFEGRPLTVRGRWINPLIFSQFALHKRLPQLRNVHKPVFIVGTGRSGTTILGVLMSMHGQVGFLNEPKAMWHSIYPGEDLIGSYTRHPAHYRLRGDAVTEEVKRAAHRLFGAYLFTTGNQRVVDKYPELVFRTDFVKAIFPDARFLFLIRNGWDTCRSIDLWSQRKGKRLGGEIHDWWGADQRKWHLLTRQLVHRDPQLAALEPVVRELSGHQERAAVEWILSMRQGMRLVRQSPESVLPVRYEQLTTRPRRTLRSILDFCDLPGDEVFFEYAERVLRPTAPRSPFAMHKDILPEFERVMHDLGYQPRQ